MAEHAADFEWCGEGEDAEVVVYAPDSTVAGWAFEQALPAARLPGVVSPVYAASSRLVGVASGFGWVAASETHVAPDLISAPEWGVLLVADAPVEGIGLPEEVSRLVSRRLSEIALPNIGEAGVSRGTGSGGRWGAAGGSTEEEGLP